MAGYLVKKIGQKSIIKSRLFPYTNSCYRVKGNIVLIGIGGNIGKTLRRFNHLFFTLKKEPNIKLLATSIIYKNPPFGYLNQDYFFNSVVLIETSLSPMMLLKRLQIIERRFRRKRSFKDAPRTLDLDIILFNKQEVNKAPKLIIPHKYYHQRESVLVPLNFLKECKWLKRVL